MEVLFLFLLILGLLVIGVPIAVALGLSSVLFLLVYSDASLASIAQTFFQAMAGHYTLLAIPFFILASSFMSTGGVARRIIRFSIALVGHLPGGLAIAGVFALPLDVRDGRSSPLYLFVSLFLFPFCFFSLLLLLIPKKTSFSCCLLPPGRTCGTSCARRSVAR